MSVFKASAFKQMKSLEDRENRFFLSASKAPLPSYDSLRDSNLRQHFESRTVQKYLQSAGWIDKSGKIIDLDRFRSKLNIIEQEFKYAEKTEYWRLKEEEDMRKTIQIQRERALEEAKRLERAAKIREENRIRRGIILAVRNQAGAGLSFGGAVSSRSSIGGSECGFKTDALRPRRENSALQAGPAGSGRQSHGHENDEDGFFVTQSPS